MRSFTRLGAKLLSAAFLWGALAAPEAWAQSAYSPYYPQGSQPRCAEPAGVPIQPVTSQKRKLVYSPGKGYSYTDASSQTSHYGPSPSQQQFQGPSSHNALSGQPPIGRSIPLVPPRPGMPMGQMGPMGQMSPMGQMGQPMNPAMGPMGQPMGPMGQMRPMPQMANPYAGRGMPQQMSPQMAQQMAQQMGRPMPQQMPYGGMPQQMPPQMMGRMPAGNPYANQGYNPYVMQQQYAAQAAAMRQQSQYSQSRKFAPSEMPPQPQPRVYVGDWSGTPQMGPPIRSFESQHEAPQAVRTLVDRSKQNVSGTIAKTQQAMSSLKPVPETSPVTHQFVFRNSDRDTMGHVSIRDTGDKQNFVALDGGHRSRHAMEAEQLKNGVPAAIVRSMARTRNRLDENDVADPTNEAMFAELPDASPDGMTWTKTAELPADRTVAVPEMHVMAEEGAAPQDDVENASLLPPAPVAAMEVSDEAPTTELTETAPAPVAEHKSEEPLAWKSIDDKSALAESPVTQAEPTETTQPAEQTVPAKPLADLAETMLGAKARKAPESIEEPAVAESEFESESTGEMTTASTEEPAEPVAVENAPPAMVGIVPEQKVTEDVAAPAALEPMSAPAALEPMPAPAVAEMQFEQVGEPSMPAAVAEAAEPVAAQSFAPVVAQSVPQEPVENQVPAEPTPAPAVVQDGPLPMGGIKESWDFAPPKDPVIAEGEFTPIEEMAEEHVVPPASTVMTKVEPQPVAEENWHPAEQMIAADRVPAVQEEIPAISAEARAMSDLNNPMNAPLSTETVSDVVSDEVVSEPIGMPVVVEDYVVPMEDGAMTPIPHHEVMPEPEVIADSSSELPPPPAMRHAEPMDRPVVEQAQTEGESHLVRKPAEPTMPVEESIHEGEFTPIEMEEGAVTPVHPMAPESAAKPQSTPVVPASPAAQPTAPAVSPPPAVSPSPAAKAGHEPTALERALRGGWRATNVRE